MTHLLHSIQFGLLAGIGALFIVAAILWGPSRNHKQRWFAWRLFGLSAAIAIAAGTVFFLNAA